MKKIIKILGVCAFITVLGIASPVMAQTTDGPATTRTTSDDRDDSGKWGLAGLLGLLGLLGLRKKDTDNRSHSSTDR